MLEECGLPYRLYPVDLARGDQFKPDFLAISPNNRIPALVDNDANGEPVTVFESGACLLYLGRKTGKFLPDERTRPVARKEVEEWLFWQVGGLGPMAGQLSHFTNYAPSVAPDADHSYSLARYRGEYERLLAVMDRRLNGRRYLAADEYTIADMSCYGWVLAHKNFKVDLAPFPHLRRWYEELKSRPALRRGISVGKSSKPNMADQDPATLQKLFKQTKNTVQQ